MRAVGGGRKRKPTKYHELHGNPSHMNLEKERGNEAQFDRLLEVPKPFKTMKAPRKPKVKDFENDPIGFENAMDAWKNAKQLSKLACAEWKRIAPGLYQQGLLDEMGLRLLEQLCNAVARYIDASNNVRKYGSVVVNSKGFLGRSPYVDIQTQAATEMRQCMTEFGMTPASASRVKANPIKPKSNNGSFMGKLKKLQSVK